ncbi:hypothetical protein JCM3770_004149 [Rhodotorula araucariae]
MVLTSYITRFCATFPLLGLLASTCRASPVPTTAARTISTPHGNVTGSLDRAVLRFTVPYAQPPVASNRFSSAREVGVWDSVDGTNLPMPCLQDGRDSSEDCLYLNIYTPSGSIPRLNLPVMVWIHGGSFIDGTPNDLDEGAQWFVQSQHVVVVAVQYRLGILGWLMGSGLSGNMGLTDVIQALEFVQSDIRSYGGDPTKVTLAGQSSGAEIVKTLLVTDNADTLFHRAILHSAPLDYPDQSFITARNISSRAVADLGCTRRGLRCLREQSAQALLAEQAQVLGLAQGGEWAHLSDFSFAEPFRVHIDGSLVTKDFRKIVASGRPLNVPSRSLIFTTVKNEGCNAPPLTRTYSIPTPLPTAMWPAIAGGLIPTFFPSRAERIMDSSAFDPSRFSNDNDAVREELAQLTTDFSWVCPNQQTALNATAATGYSGKVYLAEFDVGVSMFPKGAAGGCDGGVGHQDDLKLVFGPGTDASRSGVQNAVALEVQQRWGLFIRSGTPSNAGSAYPAWPAVALSKGDLSVLVIGADSATGNSLLMKSQRDEICKIDGGVYTPL